MSDSLQFDKAEFVTPEGQICAVCSTAITDRYFSINGKVVCTACRDRVLAGTKAEVRPDHLLAATGLGLIAAILGGAIYYGIVALIHINFGLFAVVLGWMVGGAVRRGAERRGGPVYQVMAVALTYLSLVMMYFLQLRQSGEQDVTLATFALPFTTLAQNPLRGVISAFAIWEAWKMNKQPQLVVSGPHELTRPSG
jgi:hypothetical protein